MKQYEAHHRSTGYVLSTPTTLVDPRSGHLACSIWSWVPNDDGKKAHHFRDRGEIKKILRSIGTPLAYVRFVPVDSGDDKTQ